MLKFSFEYSNPYQYTENNHEYQCTSQVIRTNLQMAVTKVPRPSHLIQVALVEIGPAFNFSFPDPPHRGHLKI